MSESPAHKEDPESLTFWLGYLSTHAVQPGTGHREFTVSQGELPLVALHAPMA